MTNHILDFSACPARLRVKHHQLLVQRENHQDVTIPLSEVAVVVVSHPQVTYTQAVLVGIAESSGVFVACDQKNLPVGLFLPLTGHSTQTERFVAQATASVPTRKRLWQQIVKSKIAAQAAVLNQLSDNDHGLAAMIPSVKSGDPTNIEAQAARRYWPYLFADAEFRRNPKHEDQNSLLNYGYAVLRAIIARAICASGLHPSLGLHHRNKYNAYCLADDLMEPFRPIVDLCVAQYIQDNSLENGVDQESKRQIIESLTSRLLHQGEQRTLFDIATRLTASLAGVFLKKDDHLDLPAGKPAWSTIP
ncbi:MAG: type II CRISPR-associated endonuclease Cas1 [Planctomycetia bacterium]|jgi:CRISPR-associated protein Cas1